MAYSHHRVYSIGNKGYSQEKSRISSYLWLNDDGLPNLVSKQTEDGPHKVKKDGCATTF